MYWSTGYNIFILLTNKTFGPTHIVVDAFNPMVVMLVSLFLLKRIFNMDDCWTYFDCYEDSCL